MVSKGSSFSSLAFLSKDHGSPGGGCSFVAVGRDVRASSLPLTAALVAGLNDRGVEVWDLGMCGTEQVYFYTSHLGLDGGIMVTASHNPPEYNGMKFVWAQSRPLSGDSGLKEIELLTAGQDWPPFARSFI